MRTIADCCLLGLAYEVVGVGILGQFVTSIDGVVTCLVGGVTILGQQTPAVLILGFDEVSAFFGGLLLAALLLCLLFAITYFEYDMRTPVIVLLSSNFAHAALLYFCAFDLLLLIFF